MKTNLKVLIGVALVGLATTFYFTIGSDMIKKYEESKKDIAFDNSKPGLWKVNTKSFLPSDPNMNKESSVDICITQKMIDDSKVKPLEEKLDVKGLKCEKDTKRINNETGAFSLLCNGVNPVNKREVTAKINGVVNSKVESGKLEINYEISNNEGEPFKFQLKTESSRIGECEPQK